MPTFEIFSYWNLQELRLVFNAVASIMGSGDYLSLLKTMALVGLISMAMAILAGFAQLPDFGRWLIMFAVFNAILLVPKVNVVLTDRTGTQAPITVSNVPLGLAAFAHSVSHVGDWLTTTFETTFSLPNDIQFRTNGTLWGHRVQQELLHTRFDNSILTSNLMEFYRECITPEYATGWIVASDMAKSNDIWTYFNGKTNPGRLVTIGAVPGAAPLAGTYGCDVAYTNLTAQILAINTAQMDTLGKRLYPGLPTAAANAAVQSAIQTSTNYMLGISASAMDTVRQTAMSNMMIDAQYLLPAQIGDAASASANLAQAQAIRSTSDSYKMMAKLAESTMPKVKNIVEIVQYSVFPIIMLLILMAGHKGGLVIKAYVMSLVWVQLWPPLYAVMHLVITMHSQELAAMTGGMGLSMSQYSLVNNAYISDAAIAGMISATAIPAIAAAIVKGGDVGAQAIAGMSAPARESERIASGMSAGNMQMGNASLSNQSAHNLSMGQYNARPTITQGGFSATGADNVGHFYGREGGMATHLVNNAGAFQNIGSKVGLSGKAAGAFQAAAENFDRTAMLETVAAHQSLSSAFNQSASFDKGRSSSTSGSSQDMTSSQAQFTRAYQEAQKIAHQYAQQHGLNQRQEAELMASAGVQASGGLNFMGNGATVTGDAGLKGKSVAGTSQVQTAAQQLARDKGFTSAISSMRTAAHQESFTRGDEATKRAALGIRNSFDQVSSHEEAASAAREKTQIYKESATRTREMGGSYDSNHINQFTDWMGQQVNPTTGKNFTVNDVEQMARLSPEYLNGYAQRFTDERLVPAIDQHMPAPTNNTADQYAANKAAIPGVDTIGAAYQQNNAVVMDEANRAGVNPNTGPANNVSGQVKAMTGQAKGDIRSGTVGVIGEGAPIQGKAERATDPTGQHNIALAMQNATAEIMPEGTMKLLDKAGLIDPNAGVAMPAADSFKGTTTEAVVDTAIAVGGMAVGGVGGRIAGEGAQTLARAAGNTAREGALSISARTEAQLADMAARPGASAAIQAAVAAPAVAGRATAAVGGAARAGAGREAVVASTTKVGGMIGGATGGGVAGSWATKHKEDASDAMHSSADAVSRTNEALNEAVLGSARNVVDGAKNLGEQVIGESEETQPPSKQVATGKIKREKM